MVVWGVEIVCCFSCRFFKSVLFKVKWRLFFLKLFEVFVVEYVVLFLEVFCFLNVFLKMGIRVCMLLICLFWKDKIIF